MKRSLFSHQKELIAQSNFLPSVTRKFNSVPRGHHSVRSLHVFPASAWTHPRSCGSPHAVRRNVHRRQPGNSESPVGVDGCLSPGGPAMNPRIIPGRDPHLGSKTAGIGSWHVIFTWAASVRTSLWLCEERPRCRFDWSAQRRSDQAQQTVKIISHIRTTSWWRSG